MNVRKLVTLQRARFKYSYPVKQASNTKNRQIDMAVIPLLGMKRSSLGP